ncbi:MAG: hypothetical protein ABI565_05805 [Vicinamibacteria bacterium]
MKLFKTLIAAALVSLPLVVAAAEASLPSVQATPSPETPTAEVVRVLMKDGSSLRGRIVDQNPDRLKIVTVGGLAMDIPRASVDRIETFAAADAPRPSDSNDTRLLFSPTGRPLAKGEGYFSDHYVVFPGVAYGLTDNISVGGGLSVVPGLGFNDQLYYGTARVGRQFSDRFAASGGILLARGGDGETDTLGVGFVTATIGKPDKSLTIGGGVVRTVTEEYSYTQSAGGAGQGNYRNKASYAPVVMVGGTARLSRRLALVSENWLVLSKDFKLSEQPFALAVRFLGDQLTADVGVVLVGNVIQEGFPLPWLSVTYHFGPKR